MNPQSAFRRCHAMAAWFFRSADAWAPFRRCDQRRLEQSLEGLEGAAPRRAPVPVNGGRGEAPKPAGLGGGGLGEIWSRFFSAKNRKNKKWRLHNRPKASISCEGGGGGNGARGPKEHGGMLGICIQKKGSAFVSQRSEEARFNSLQLELGQVT